MKRLVSRGAERVLRVMADDETPHSGEELAERLDMTEVELTGYLRELEKVGFIARWEP